VTGFFCCIGIENLIVIPSLALVSSVVDEATLPTPVDVLVSTVSPLLVVVAVASGLSVLSTVDPAGVASVCLVVCPW